MGCVGDTIDAMGFFSITSGALCMMASVYKRAPQALRLAGQMQSKVGKVFATEWLDLLTKRIGRK